MLVEFFLKNERLELGTENFIVSVCLSANQRIFYCEYLWKNQGVKTGAELDYFTGFYCKKWKIAEREIENDGLLSYSH